MSALFTTTILAALASISPPAVILVDADEDAGWDHPFEFEEHRVSALDASAGMLIKTVTVHSAVQPAFVADVLVTDGLIQAIGNDLTAPEGVHVVDGTGKHLAPGVVDTHSHMGIDGGVNEGTLIITADCDITDVIDADDVSLYRAAAGGVTTIQCLHGSANAIGGRSEVLKLRWGQNADGMRFEEAPQGIKFALGENPKRSRSRGGSGRFPTTRMGVESVFDRGFRRAQEYKAEWDAYAASQARGEDVGPPRRDIRLDVLVGVLDGTVNVHSHCYRADEILMLLRAAERYGFQVKTLQHVLEGYKVAHEIEQHGAGTSTFSDWWGYKIEAYDAIPQNAAFLDEVGAVSTINSDSGEMVRRLYAEAGKSVRYAGQDPVAALRLVTLNGAKQLGVDHLTGSIEVGKAADLALLDGEPLSVYSKVLWTMVDGDVVFTRRDAFDLDDAELAPHELSEDRVVEASLDPVAGPITAIVGGTLHPVTAPAIENGVLLIQRDRIIALGAGLEVPDGATVIDASGKHVWPGMIALASPVGIGEISSVPGTIDTREGGGSQPDLRTTASVNAASAQIGVTRWTGITRAQVAPQGGGPMRGQSAVIRLHGDTWEELLTLDRDMLHISFPRVRNEEEKKEVPEAVAKMKDMLEAAREYDHLRADARDHGMTEPPFDARLDALVPFAKGEAPVALYVDNAQSILYAIQFAQEEELDALLIGCTEGWKVADVIAASGFDVAIGPTNAVPGRFDPYDAQFANAAVLHRAGCRVAIFADESQNTRNLPFHAGIAAAYGLPREEALRAVTLYPAEILGMSDQLGSLTPGKLADVVVTDGDLLDTTTQVEAILIDGESVDLANHQSDLYEEWRARHQRALHKADR